MQALKQWQLTEHSENIRIAVDHLNEQGLNIATPTDAKSEYEALRQCRRHWQKLRKAGIELIKVSEYPQVRQVEQVGANHWRCTNHSKGTAYDITRDDLDQFSCTCPANTHGVFCSHMEELFASPIYQGNSDPTDDVDWEDVYHGRLAQRSFHQDNDSSIFGVLSKDLSKNAVDSEEPKSIPYPGEVQPSPRKVLFRENSSKKVDLALPLPQAEQIFLASGHPATKDQVNTIHGVEHWFHQSNESFYCINGAAGVGKSSLLQTLVERLPVTRIAIIAPSNKAVKVVQSKVSQVPGKVVESMTVARFLAIRPSYSGEKQTFERDYTKDPLVDQYDLVFVDEGSMMAENTFQLLNDELMMLLNRNMRCIIMGDSAQLPPVNEGVSKVFEAIDAKSILTEVVRHDGPVLEWASSIRTQLTSPRVIRPESSWSKDKRKGLWVLSKKEWESNLLRAFVRAKEVGKHPDSVRALAYTNKRVDSLNSRIRAAINPGAKQLEIGDRLILKAPFLTNGFHDDDSWLQTSDECTVIREPVAGEVQGVPVWMVLVELIDGRSVQVPVIKMSGMPVYKQRLTELRQAKRFSTYWSLQESFCHVAHAYALTVHNSQGSTFNDVFVDAKNILRCSERTPQGTWVRQHLLYVANTRASDRVFVTFE